MKLLLILLPLLIQAKSFDYWNKTFQSLSYQERSSLVKTFVKALPYDMSFSLTAIHFKESFGDRYKININNSKSIDVGSFMINTKEYLRKRNIKNNSWNTSRAIEELLDYETNFLEALDILNICLKKAKGNWKLSYQYYNGWTSNSKRSIEYSKDIVNIIKVLKVYFNNSKIKVRN